MRSLLILFAFLLLTSCRKPNPPEEIISFPMAAVAFVPMFNSSDQKQPWNISEELTELIFKQGFKDNCICLISTNTPWMTFDEAYRKVQAEAGRTDFIVLANLLEHHSLPTERLKQPNAERCDSALYMKVRLTVFDTRDTPHILLDQTICSSDCIPKMYEFWNYSKNADTPLKQAHERLVAILLERIQEAVQHAY